MNGFVKRTAVPAAVLMAAVALGGCGSTPSASSGSSPAAAPSGPKIGPGMDASGNVVDSKKVEAGYGEKIKGLDDWEGEITGHPAPGSKFGPLKIGMSASQVVSLVGQPNDQGSYITGKAFIPFYFGSDKWRYELVYKGQGRLIFASSAGYAFGEMHLIWIIHSASESGTR